MKKQKMNQRFTPDIRMSTIQGDSHKKGEKILRGDQLQFKILSESELKALKDQAINEINLKYKTKISTIREKYENLTKSRRGRIRDYIKKMKENIQNLLISVKKKCRLEVDFLNYKSKQINYENILFTIHVWVKTIMGEIKK